MPLIQSGAIPNYLRSAIPESGSVISEDFPILFTSGYLKSRRQYWQSIIKAVIQGAGEKEKVIKNFSSASYSRFANH